MKRKLSRLLAAVFMAAALLTLLPQRAEAAGASFSGSSSLRAGSSVTVTFSVSGSNIVAIRGTLSYDSSQLELTGTSQLVGSPWTMDMNGSTVVLYDSSLTHPISSSSVFSATFRVKSSVAAGTTVSASVTGISVSDGANDTSLGTASWSATIAAPLSGNAKLGSLSCSNASLSPAFSPDTTSYSATVPYSVSSLSLSYKAQESGASVSVSGNSLSVGSNAVTITVTAPNGATKKYVIYVTRQQDPNYVPSSNALLRDLTVSVGRLSPSFSPDVKDYVVYVPFEVTAAEVDGVAQDGRARSVIGASAQLEPGDNALRVVCTAEDNATQGVYNVHFYRMPAYAGILPKIADSATADYTAVEEALAKVPLVLNGYTDETVAALQKAVRSVVRDLPADKQADVDAMAKAVTDAVAGLKKIPPVPEPTLWEKLTAILQEKLSVPYISDVTGSLTLKTWAIAAGVLLLLLAYLIGTLIGRLVGRHRTLRRLREEQEDLEEERAALEAAAAGTPADDFPVEAVAAAAAAGTEASENAASAEEAAPVEETVPVEEAAPVEETAPVEEAAPVEETASVEETAPTEENAPAEENVPIEEVVSVEEIAAAEEPAPAEEPASEPEPVRESAPEPEPEPVSVEEAAPGEEAQPAEDAAPAVENGPAAEEPVDPVDDISWMSIDDLLDDIKNM